MSRVSRRALRRCIPALVLVIWSARAEAEPLPPPATWVSPQPTGERLTSLSGKRRVVWAVGDAGTMLNSKDGGGTWVAVPSGTDADLRAVWAASESDVWVVGSGGTILHSVDTGAHWQRLGPGDPIEWRAVWAIGEEDVYAVGEAGRVWRSRDRGRSFQIQRPLGDTDEVFTTIWGNAADDVYLGGDRGSLLATSDRGEHWQIRWPQTPNRDSPQPRAGRGRQIRSLTGGGRGHLVAVFGGWIRTPKRSASSATVARTRDGGKTWQYDIRVQPPASQWPAYGPFMAADERTIYGAVTFDKEDSRRPQGFVVSQDGGATFERRGFFDAPTISALWRDSSGTLFAAGAGGVILTSLDEGRSWRDRSVHPFGTPDLRAIWTRDRGVWVVGRQCTALHSTDAGHTFSVLHPCAGGDDDLGSVWSSGGDDVYVAGRNVYLSVDRGRHFTVATPPAPAPAWSWKVWGSGPADVYASGCGVWRSTDRGRSWRVVYGKSADGRCPADSEVFGSGASDVFVLAGADLMHSTTSGVSWEPRTIPQGCRSVWPLDATSLFAFGSDNALFRSSDAGVTWQRASSPLGSHNSFIAMAGDGGGLFLLGTGGSSTDDRTVLVQSTDRGATWRVRMMLPVAMRDIVRVAGSDVVVVGWRGVVQRVH
jgi:photosystem II stability/assembly factor-like uncharacterized protein